MVFDVIDKGVGVLFVVSDVVVYSGVGPEFRVQLRVVVVEAACHEYVGLQDMVG